MQVVDGKKWPAIPPDLRDVDLRLPPRIRELCANPTYSNDAIGRIVRCLALRTDVFVSADVAYEIGKFQRIISLRTRNSMRVAKHRKSAGTTSTLPLPPKDGKIEPNTPQASGLGRRLSGDLFSVMNEPGAPKRSQHPPVTPGQPILPTIPSELDLTNAAQDDATPTTQSKETATPSIEGAPFNLESPLNTPADTRIDMTWIPVQFEKFWKEYPRKVAKQGTIKAFTKIIKKQRDIKEFMELLLESLAFWKAQDQWTRDKGKFIPYPASWLNAGHWRDSAEERSMDLGCATFLKGDAETDDDLLKRMQGE